MIRIYAPFVVAFVENTKFSGDRTEVNLSRHTMGLVRFSFNPYASISSTGYSSDPSPAFFYRGFINLIPESLFFWNTSIIVPMNEFVWFTLDSPISRIGMIGKFSFPSAPTLAITKGRINMTLPPVVALKVGCGNRSGSRGSGVHP